MLALQENGSLSLLSPPSVHALSRQTNLIDNLSLENYRLC